MRWFHRLWLWLTRLAREERKPARLRARPAPRRWSLECLEGRRLLSTITEIQQIGAASQFLSGTSSYSLPVNTAVGAGHSVLIEFVCDITSGTVSASDSAGNTYTNDADISSTSTSLRTLIFSSHGVKSIAAGGSVTISYSGAVVAEGIVAEEFAGLTSSGTLDKTHTKANTSTSTAPT
ncbi:MAG TPA: hypothetical protein VJ783_13365, partial [Pirellulales bacterium]|nr:hypothetical protein [Pirellulales bacterium]